MVPARPWRGFLRSWMSILSGKIILARSEEPSTGVSKTEQSVLVTILLGLLWTSILGIPITGSGIANAQMKPGELPTVIKFPLGL